MNGPLIESHTHRHPRLVLFYGIIALMVVVLVSGLAYRQLFKTSLYSERERVQNQRRVIIPGPRGNIYDREGRLLVTNRARFSVVLNVADLRPELRSTYREISATYRKLPADERPNTTELAKLTRAAVAQKYLNIINGILARKEKVDSADLERHFSQTLLLPFVLLDDLAADEYARLIERLPVNSPLQVYASSTRYYPYGATAAHVLGYIGIDDDPEAEEFPGEDLMTLKMKGSYGRDGLEKQFDEQLQGEAGGAIYRVDPTGFKVDLPIETKLPVQGRNLRVSLDVDLQMAAEKAMEGKVGAAVVLDVKTGEVLVMASAPTYDLNQFVPRLSRETFKQVEDAGGWLNRATQGQYPPGSTFKIVTATAGLRAGSIDESSTRKVCVGFHMVGGRRFPCAARASHGEMTLRGALRQSCNVFFIEQGLQIGPELLASEARRFGFGHPTGIELPHEFSKPVVPDRAWKRQTRGEPWYDGDTANVSIGQGDLLVNPLQVASMVASFARGETETKPTLLHVPNRPPQRSTPIGLAPEDYNAILEGLAQGYQIGTGRLAKVDGLLAGTKTGTAQKGRIELAWIVALAPIDNPQLAIAVVLEGQEEDANYGGGVHSAPVARAIMETWKQKRESKPAAVSLGD